MIATSPELQNEIRRLSCLKGFTHVGAAEIEVMLCKACENDPHAYAVIQHFIDNSSEYPRPVEVRQIAAQVGPPTPAMVSIHDPACPRCGGAGFISELRTVDGMEVYYGRRCYGVSILIERSKTAGEYHVSATGERKEATPEQKEELAAIFASQHVKNIPPTEPPPTPDPEWLVLQEDPDHQPKLRVNGEAAALQKAKEIAELERRFGKIERQK